MTPFRRGDFVHVVGEPSNIGVILEVVPPGLPRVRFGTDNRAGTYWPHDLVRLDPNPQRG